LKTEALAIRRFLGGKRLLNNYVLGGVDSVAGQPTPNDTQFPASVAGAAPHDGAAPSGANYAAKLANNSADGSGLSVQLQSTGVTVPSHGILHGPYLVSKDAISLKPGDSVSFDWQATGGSDAYDVIGYLVNEETGDSRADQPDWRIW
jgi:hypothetical protein